MRSIPLFVAIAGLPSAVGACSADPPLDCPGGTRLVQGDYGGRGEMSMWCERKDGTAHGPYVHAWQDGTAGGAPKLGPTLWQGAFADGLADGTWRTYAFEDSTHRGPLVREERFARGYPDGVWKEWSPEGLPLSEHTWRLGTACGTWLEFGGDGEIVNQVDHGACADVDEPPPIDPAIAPSAALTWDGTTCPEGLVFFVSDADASACSDSAGVLQGPFIRWHARAPDAAEGEARVPAAYGDMRDGAREGAWVFVHPSGYVAARGDFAADRETGPWERFGSDRHREEVGPWRDGLRDGAFTTYNPNGTKASEGSWRAGLRDGAWRFNGPSGLPYETITYAAGVRDGPYTSHFADGGVAEEGAYVDDLEDGTWRTYDDDGTLATEDTRVAGRLHGPSKAFDEAGLPLSEGSYVDDVAQGAWTVWFSQFGERVKQQGMIVDGLFEGPWPGTHDGGGHALEVSYTRGQRDSMSYAWWKNGGKLWEGAFEGGLAHGHWLTWQPDGTPFADANYVFGELWGPYKEWWPSGGPKAEGEYYGDQRIGVWTFWSEDGVPRQETFQ